MAVTIRIPGYEDYINGTANIKTIIMGPHGVGKGHPLATGILTPAGWSRVGDLEVGSSVIGSDGRPTKVTGLFDRGDLPVYRVTLDDGSSVLCDGDHLWHTMSDKQHKIGTHTVRSVNQMMANFKPVRVPLVLPVQHDKIDLPIDPYVLGVLIANGYLAGDTIQFCTNDQPIIDMVQRRAPQLVLSETTSANSTARHFTVKGFQQAVAEVGLRGHKSATKFIPAQYLTAHEEARRDLLAALLDCDGTVSSRGNAMYFTCSPQLVSDVTALVESLGGTARVGRDLRRAAVAVDYRLHINLPDATAPFSLPRKANLWTPSVRRPMRRIVSIAPEGVAEVRCIQVAAADSLYVTERYLVTHNTRWSSFWDRPLLLAAEDGTAAVLDRAMPTADIGSYQDMLDVLGELKRAQMKPKDDRRFRTVVLDTADAWQKVLMAEYTRLNGSEFTGWEAWSWLDVRQQVVLDKLMALDYHVIVLLHYKESTKDDVVSIHPRLKGDAKDSILDPFDLIGLMDWEFGLAPADGDRKAQRTMKRSLTFIPSPKASFLKDRFFAMPKEVPVTFDASDYDILFKSISDKAATIPKAEVLDAIPTGASAEDDAPAIERKATVVGAIAGGPVPTAAPPAPPKAAPVKAATPVPAASENRSRADILRSEAMERLQRKTAGVTDAPAEAAAFTSQLAETVAAIEPVPAEGHAPGIGELAPGEPFQGVTPGADPFKAATPVPTETETAVAVLEETVGPVTEVDRMGMAVGAEGVGTGNADPVCGTTLGDTPQPLQDYIDGGNGVPCGAPLVEGKNDTFIGVAKVKYRMALCSSCFTTVRQNVR
jgi:hypothetical protein